MSKKELPRIEVNTEALVVAERDKVKGHDAVLYSGAEVRIDGGPQTGVWGTYILMYEGVVHIEDQARWFILRYLTDFGVTDPDDRLEILDRIEKPIGEAVREALEKMGKK